MDASKDLKKRFTELATNLIDLQSITRAIEDGLNTDVKEGDYVIGTGIYNSGVFVVDPVYKDKLVRGEYRKVKLPNPYEERVTDSDPQSRLTISVKTYKDDPDARTERRVKVKKLNLLDWDEENNCYPRHSEYIIFREHIIDFKEKYECDLRSINYMLREMPTHPHVVRNKSDLERDKLLLERLIEIPPFKAYSDRKYGILVKREIAMNRIILKKVKDPELRDLPKRKLRKAVEEEVEGMIKRADERKGEADNFHEAIVMEAFKPERVMNRLETYGEEALEEHVVTGVGKA